MPDFLLEFISEEMPAHVQVPAREALVRHVHGWCGTHGVPPKAVRGFVTPRRLAVVVTGLPATQPAQRIEKKGPRENAPAQAIDGFLTSLGLESLDACTLREDSKGAVWTYIQEQEGQDLTALLPEMVASFLESHRWPRSMTWPESDLRWVRPLRRIVAVWGKKTLQGHGTGLAFEGTTWGHRFLSPEPLAVHAGNYEEVLREHHVVACFEARVEAIRRGLEAQAAGFAQDFDEALVHEVAGLVEWPQVMVGGFPAEFLNLPEKILTETMAGHQKYFLLCDDKGRAAPAFAMVSNMGEQAAILEGNERVLRARLYDAAFFWAQDRKTVKEHAFDSWLEKLDRVVFHAKIGTVAEKAHRMERLAGEIGTVLKLGSDAHKHAQLAAATCKADLVSATVYEIPSMQGLAGGQLAGAVGYDRTVGQAMAEHYRPQGPEDALPSSKVAAVVALADKLDTLAQFWRIGEKPTGSKDPFALRRAALGVIRIIVEQELTLPLRPILQPMMAEEQVEDLLGFIIERLKVVMRGQGLRHDHIAAVASGDDGGLPSLHHDTHIPDDLLLIVKRAQRLHGFLDTEDGQHLLALYRRAYGIVRRETWEYVPTAAVPEQVPADEATTNLYDRMQSLSLKGAEDRESTQALAGLRPLIDDFFETVHVNNEDPDARNGYLTLLAELVGMIDTGYARLRFIEG